jgi:hypothetical protein
MSSRRSTARAWKCLLVIGALWPALSFAQNIFIDSPSDGATLVGPYVTLRMSVSDYPLGNRMIRVAMDGTFIGETNRLKVTLPVGPGTHQVEVWLVNRRSETIETSLPETVKFTIEEPSL